MSTHAPVSVIPEETPNPASNKFTVNRTLLSDAGRDYTTSQAAAQSPLARELFLLNGVSGVYIGPNFVTVTLAPGGNWWAVRPMVTQAIESFLQTGQAAVGDAETKSPPPPQNFSAIEIGIMQILENEIQPAVAMDGGYISFAGYDKGVVKVHLRGACHSCPSSLVTLKSGIENRLKQQFPEIQAVEAV